MSISSTAPGSTFPLTPEGSRANVAPFFSPLPPHSSPRMSQRSAYRISRFHSFEDRPMPANKAQSVVHSRLSYQQQAVPKSATLTPQLALRIYQASANEEQQLPLDFQ